MILGFASYHLCNTVIVLRGVGGVSGSNECDPDCMGTSVGYGL